MPQSFNCPNCGGPLDYPGGGALTIRCPFCNTSVIVPEELREGAPAVRASAESQAQALAEITRLIRRGRRVEAINLFRETFNTGLKEAQDAVDDLEAGRRVQIGSVTVQTSSRIDVDAPGVPPQQAANIKEIVRLIQGGNKIEAVKLYRETFGGGLKEAKDAVDRLEAGQSVQQSSFTVRPPSIAEAYTPTIQSEQSSRWLGGCVALTALVGLIAGLVVAAGLPILQAIDPSLLTRLQSVGQTAWPPLTAAPLPVIEAKPTATPPFAEAVLTFGEEGTGPGFFTDARHVAVDKDGNIYVGEYGTDRIQVFDPTGKFISQWIAGDGKSPLRGIAVDRKGIFYAVVKGEINRFEAATGKPLGKIPYAPGWGFDDVAATADGGLVAAWYKNRDDIVRLDPQGQVQFVIEKAISGVTDSAELDTRVAVDGLGNIYALGQFNEAVFVFSPAGKYLNKFGGQGDAPGQFTAPTAIAVDGRGRVYVSDFKGIQVFDSAGRYINVIDAPGFAYGMRFDDQGNLFVTNGKQIIKFALNGP